LNPSRWLTLAIRLLCTYARGIYPAHLCDVMIQLVLYIVQVLIISWFEIKKWMEDCNQSSFQWIKLQSPTI